MNVLSFEVSLGGDIKPYNETISQARARIFYKGLNRNGGYITDDFAQQLAATLPYAPVKGIYDAEDVDYTDHGDKRTEGRIYGIVSAEPNMSWEDHEDDDGVVRTYLHADVLLYTALYKEARAIPGKGLSMELYRPSIQGKWQFKDGHRCFIYSAGCFLGLQVLGDSTEPCFEGAAFFNHTNAMEEALDKLNQYQKIITGGSPMAIVNYKLSDEDKRGCLMELLNPGFGKDDNWALNYEICQVYDDYAVVWNFAERQFERVYYTKNDETDSVEITNQEVVYFIDVTETERDALQAARAANGDTFAAIDSKVLDAENFAKKIAEDGLQIVELNNQITTLTTERDTNAGLLSTAEANLATVQSEYAAANTQLAAVTEERNALATYRKNVEDGQKNSIIDGYTTLLPEEVLSNYRAHLDNYSLDTLDKELTYEVKKAKPSIFNLDKSPKPSYVPIDSGAGDGLNDLLARYQN